MQILPKDLICLLETWKLMNDKDLKKKGRIVIYNLHL